jgi:FkbM family methyltransferase
MYRVAKLEGHSFLIDFLQMSSNILDLGAHRGNFAKGLGKYGNFRIYGVEADPAVYKNLNSLSKSSYTNLTLAAIGSLDGVIQLTQSKEFCSSVYNVKFQKGNKIIEVPSLSFSTLVSQIGQSSFSLVKMDIEGSEVDLIDSMSDEELLMCSQLTIEFHDFCFPELKVPVAEIRLKLRNLGFREIRFSLDNTDVLYLNPNLHIKRRHLYLAIFFYKWIRGMRRTFSRILRFDSANE